MVEPLLTALEATAPAQYLRGARWGYAAVNAVHILGLGLLIGAIVPLDLRLLGVWRGVPRAALVRVLVPTAAVGLAVAIATGLLLFAVRAREYAGLEVVQAKLALVAIGGVAAIAIHLHGGWLLERAGAARVAGHASLSLLCWLGALLCGRLIAFVGQ